MTRYLLLLPSLLALSACVQPPVATAPPSCPAASLSHLVGTPLSTFNTGTVKSPVRILAPGSIMTMDHRPDRLNIYHNTRGVIEKVTCG